MTSATLVPAYPSRRIAFAAAPTILSWLSALFAPAVLAMEYDEHHNQLSQNRKD